VLKLRRWPKFFAIVGMNPLFIYLFAETGGADWLGRIARPFTRGVFGWTGELPTQIMTSLAVWARLWSLCLWLDTT
jgi:hypothetical protein